MSLARDIADLGSVTSRLDTVGAGSGSFGVGRNVIVNSAMMVSQRGTSFASVGNVYTLDRFEMYKQNTSAAFTITQSSVTDLAGFANALKVDCTTADTSLASNEQAYISHKLEGQDLQRFQKGHATALGFTLSFYVKTNKTGLYTVSMFDRDNTRKVNGSYTVADANWNRYTINFPADTTGKFDDDNASSLEIFFNLYAGSDTNTGTLSETWAASADAGSTTGQVNFADSTSNDWEITGIQLETGSGAATDFEHRSFGDELQRCQRYYNQVQKGIWGVASAAGNPVFHFYPPTEMRVAPSYSLTVNKVSMGDMIAQGFDLTTAVINAGAHNTSEAMSFNFTASSFSATMTSYRPLLLESGGSFNGEVQISAEL